MQRLVGVHKEGRDILKSCRICFIHRWFKEQWGVAPRHQHQELHQQRDLNICSRWRSSLLLHQLYCYDYRDVYGFKRLCAEADRERLTIHVRSARCFMGRRYSLQLFDSVTCSPSHSRPSTEQSTARLIIVGIGMAPAACLPVHRSWWPRTHRKQKSVSVLCYSLNIYNILFVSSFSLHIIQSVITTIYS